MAKLWTQIQDNLLFIIVCIAIIAASLTEDYQTPNAVFLYLGVRLWVIRFIVKRATAQIVS